jgi:hypothetical protein
MAIKFRKQAIKFLEKANPDDVENIREQLNHIVITVEEQGVIPFTELIVSPRQYFTVRMPKCSGIFYI